MNFARILAAGLTVISLILSLVALANPSIVGASLDPEEQAFLGLINSYRAENGFGPLSINGALTQSARWMSNDMAGEDYWPNDEYCAQFSQHAHCDSVGRDAISRILVFGYPYYTWKAENLAAGTETAALAFDMWKASAAHNANMLAAEFNEIGISRAYSETSVYGWYWTTDFGGQPTDPPAAPPMETAPTPPAPVMSPAPTPEPTPVPTPESIPTPAPEPQPESKTVPPNWDTIYAQVQPWWQQLIAVQTEENAILTSLAHLAGDYLGSSSETSVRHR